MEIINNNQQRRGKQILNNTVNLYCAEIRHFRWHEIWLFSYKRIF